MYCTLSKECLTLIKEFLMIKNSALQKLYYLFAALCFGYLTCINVIQLTQFLPDFKAQLALIAHKEVLIFGTILIILLAGLCFIFFTRISKTSHNKVFQFLNQPLLFVIFLFAFSLSIKVLFVLKIQTIQYSDFKLFYFLTTEIASQNFSKYVNSSYFGIWAYQVGFPTLMSPLYNLFGHQQLPLVLANCLFMALTNIIVYFIARQWLSDKIARGAAFLYALTPFVLSTSSVYTNQHLATFFFYSGILVLFYNKRFTLWRACMAGGLFALGNMVRPEAITLLLALLALGLLMSLNKPQFKVSAIKSNLKPLYLPFFSVLIVYLVGSQLLSQAIVSSGINPHGLVNNFPLYKFVVGLNPASSGTFSKEDANHLFSNELYIQNPDLRDLEATRIIKERIGQDPTALLKLVNKKIQIMWAPSSVGYPAFLTWDLDQTVHFSRYELPALLIVYTFMFIDFLISLCAFLLATLSTIFAFKAKENNIVYLFTSLLMILVFGIYLFIEVQHRYSYFAFPLILLLGASGFQGLKKNKKAQPL